MARVCSVTGRRTEVGKSIVRKGLPKRTGGIGLNITGTSKRKFKPNIQKKRIYVPELGRWVTVKLSAKAIKTIAKNGAYQVLRDAGVIKPAKSKKKKKKAKQA